VTGQLFSTIGDFCYAIALPWLVLSGHGSAALLGVVLACYGVPRTVLIHLGGVLADRIGPRKLMMIADIGRCVLVSTLAVLASKHTASLIALGPIAALIGAGEGLFLPASFSILPSLLDGKRLGAANALSSAAVQVGTFLGFALGGALVAVTRGSTAAFAVDAASFAVSALTLALIPAAAREPAGAPGNGGDEDDPAGEPASEEGALMVLRRWRALQVIIVVVIAANLAGGGMGEVALPSLAQEHWGAAGYGALLACSAAGAFIGTLGATRTAHVAVPAILVSALFLIYGLVTALIPFAGGEAGAAAALFIGGVTSGMGNVVAITMVQRSIPPAITGQITGVVILCAFGTFPLSVAMTGLLVRHVGPAPFFPLAGALVAAAMLFGLSRPEFRVFGSPGPAGSARPAGSAGSAGPAEAGPEPGTSIGRTRDSSEPRR
jgi:predicted MFS family arabinose efflux permease